MLLPPNEIPDRQIFNEKETPLIPRRMQGKRLSLYCIDHENKTDHERKRLSKL